MVGLGIVFQKRRQDTEWGFGGSVQYAAQARPKGGGRKGHHGGINDRAFAADGNGHQGALQESARQQIFNSRHNQAMNFYNLSDRAKAKQIKRVMTESAAQFTHAATARQYIELYEKMLKRPLII